MKGVVREINIIDWDNNKKIEFLKSNKDVVVLIEEEESFYIIPQVGLVINDWSSRHDRGTCMYPISELIEKLKD